MKMNKGHVYHNGSHYCYTESYTLPESVKAKRKPVPKLHRYKEEIFELYRYVSREVIGNRAKRIFRRDIGRASKWIFDELKERHPDDEKLTVENVTDTVTMIYRMYLLRYKTLKRKVGAYNWNWFVTITYDDEKFKDEAVFRDTLKRSLNHFVSRRGWRYFGVFERGEEEDRLHFHGVLYVPDGEMVGKIEKKGYYSTKRHRFEYCDENDFFFETFGKNDFSPVDQIKLRKRGAFSYLTKYIVKDNEKLVYSRHAPATRRDVEGVEVLEIDDTDLENPLDEGKAVPFHFDFHGAVYIVMNTVELDPFWRELEVQAEWRELGILEKMLGVA